MRAGSACSVPSPRKDEYQRLQSTKVIVGSGKPADYTTSPVGALGWPAPWCS